MLIEISFIKKFLKLFHVQNIQFWSAWTYSW